MPGIVGLSLLLLALALLVLVHGQERIAGLTPEEFASLASLGSLALVAAGWIIGEFRGRWTQGLRAVVLWLAIGLVLVGVYAYRDELQEAAVRILGEIAPGRPIVTPQGEVAIARRADGSFTVAGRIDDRDARFIFDTGASAVVLTTDTAMKVGLKTAPSDYTVPVFTANGRTMAAPVLIDRLSVGPIVERKVRALVAQPGALRDNLLGMTFLERLASYEVRSNRLILRGRGSPG